MPQPFAHGGVDADIGVDAGQHEVADAAQAQDQLEIGDAEAVPARPVNDRLAWQGREFRDDLPTWLASHRGHHRPGWLDQRVRQGDAVRPIISRAGTPQGVVDDEASRADTAAEWFQSAGIAIPS